MLTKKNFKITLEGGLQKNHAQLQKNKMHPGRKILKKVVSNALKIVNWQQSKANRIRRSQSSAMHGIIERAKPLQRIQVIFLSQESESNQSRESKLLSFPWH